MSAAVLPLDIDSALRPGQRSAVHAVGDGWVSHPGQHRSGCLRRGDGELAQLSQCEAERFRHELVPVVRFNLVELLGRHLWLKRVRTFRGPRLQLTSATQTARSCVASAVFLIGTIADLGDPVGYPRLRQKSIQASVPIDKSLDHVHSS